MFPCVQMESSIFQFVTISSCPVNLYLRFLSLSGVSQISEDREAGNTKDTETNFRKTSFNETKQNNPLLSATSSFPFHKNF